MDLVKMQKELCAKYGAEYTQMDPESIAGVSASLGHEGAPINGLRHPQTDTSS